MIPAALILVFGAIAWALLDHRLRVRRWMLDVELTREMALGLPDSEPDKEEPLMTMSDQQLNTLGLSHVRRKVASGKYTAADVKRWKEELGEARVQEIVGAAEAERPAKKESPKAATQAKE